MSDRHPRRNAAYLPWADEDEPGPLLVCRQPPCSAALYHDQATHDYLQHHGPPPAGMADPLHVDELEVGRRIRDAETRDEFRSGGAIVWIVTAWILAIAIVAVAAFLIANRSAAPRSAPDPPAPQPTAASVGLVQLVASVQASTSDRAPSGAPLPAAGEAAAFGPAGDPFNGRESPRHRPARESAETAGSGAPNTLSPRVGREGDITHMGDDYPWPVDYLAIPLGPGIHVRICGPAACRDMVSTDAGPNRERLLAGVIADVSWQRFEVLCGVQARFGHCPGSWIRIGASSPTLPPTDVTP